MIKVIVVEDSPVVRDLLVHILDSDPEIRVIDTAGNGEEAIAAAGRNRPDLITMDVHMPKMDGFEATRIIMETNAVPIVIVTGSTSMMEMECSFQALEAGALTVIQKPVGISHPAYKERAGELIRTVKLMSEVKVVRRWARRSRKAPETRIIAPAQMTPADIRVVAIGASTGGPPVIQQILSGLPKEFPVPVLIVQHMAVGFIQGFVEWLGQTSGLPVHVAIDGSRILSGHAYVAPEKLQMKVGNNGRLSCSGNGHENGLCPAVSHLFRSVAEVFGMNAMGILLTGMGKDGAEELKLMREKGAVTVAQDEESSVVFGMPGEAVKLNAAKYVLPPAGIVDLLGQLAIKQIRS
ncbi:MAG: chemotaxis-specific protein-glutamate methyltransferase CheB [Nitrospirae bacterium]|nr:MAG: chemotaxis-specific protein-glutamate methyltransferase CheB [Nitrospirota bacterium]